MDQARFCPSPSKGVILAFDKLRPRTLRSIGSSALPALTALNPSKGAMLAFDKLRPRHAASIGPSALRALSLSKGARQVGLRQAQAASRSPANSYGHSALPA